MVLVKNKLKKNLEERTENALVYATKNKIYLHTTEKDHLILDISKEVGSHYESQGNDGFGHFRRFQHNNYREIACICYNNGNLFAVITNGDRYPSTIYSIRDVLANKQITNETRGNKKLVSHSGNLLVISPEPFSINTRIVYNIPENEKEKVSEVMNLKDPDLTIVSHKGDLIFGLIGDNKNYIYNSTKREEIDLPYSEDFYLCSHNGELFALFYDNMDVKIFNLTRGEDVEDKINRGYNRYSNHFLVSHNGALYRNVRDGLANIASGKLILSREYAEYFCSVPQEFVQKILNKENKAE